MDRFHVPRGTRDFPPDEMVVRNYVERVVRDTFESFGFQQIQTPTFESFDLFAARSGEEIRESMFIFASDAGRYALRPELTAPVCRLVVSGTLSKTDPPTPFPYKLYYLGPCFRYCKPQAGRYREFFQVGTELIGASGELADAEVIALAVKVLRRLNIPGCQLKIGNVGIFQKLLSQQNGNGGQLRQDWELDVIHDIDHLVHTTEMCEAIAQRAERRQANIQDDIAFVSSTRSFLYHIQDRIDYSGDSEIRPNEDVSSHNLCEQAESLPKVAEDTFLEKWTTELSLPEEMGRLLLEVSHLRGPGAAVIPQAKDLLAGTDAMESLDNLSRVVEELASFGVTGFEVVLGIVRNLDFYTGTVFEIDSALLGAQKQVCGGGRYDNLVKEFGGESMPATGFAFGFDRLVKAFKEAKNDEGMSRAPVDVLVIYPEGLRSASVKIAELLRDSGLRAAVDLCGRSIEDQKEYAGKLGAKYSVVIDETSAEKVKLREKVRTGIEETELPVSALVGEITRRIKSETNSGN